MRTQLVDGLFGRLATTCEIFTCVHGNVSCEAYLIISIRALYPHINSRYKNRSYTVGRNCCLLTCRSIQILQRLERAMGDDLKIYQSINQIKHTLLVEQSKKNLSKLLQWHTRYITCT